MSVPACGGHPMLNRVFRTRSRTFAAPIAVGTIDQALLSIIRARHAWMRAAFHSRHLLVVVKSLLHPSRYAVEDRTWLDQQLLSIFGLSWSFRTGLALGLEQLTERQSDARLAGFRPQHFYP